MLGTTLSHYKILETLGEGGMGVVYKARDLKLDRFVAIKVLPPEKTADPSRKQRFLQEARAASALNHPNIVVIHEIAEEGGLDFIVMEYVPGRTLDQVIPRKGLRPPETLRYAAQIASALAAAHEAGITHRDLKPGNLMVTDKGVVKVLDFGLAKLEEKTPLKPDDATRTERPVTEKGAILGTVAYMSPEQAEGKTVDARSDIFSFGSVLHEMCTGVRAFAGETKMSTLSLILREDPRPVRASNEEVPQELERIISRCLRKNPARRFQSTADLQIALEELREESDSGRLAGSMDASPKSAAVPWVRWAVIVVGVALLSFAGVLMMGRKPAAQQSQQGPVLTQLTFDTGLTTEPSYWAQGNLIAYASDRATDGQNLDIWIQQLNGGEARRLTTHTADDRTPDIAPDGSKIVFRSERDGGGLYVVPTIGGAERKIAPNGYDPKFSPDGQWIAYWTGDASAIPTVFSANSSDARIMLVPANGGSPKQAFNGTGAFRPVWSPDSKRILFGWWKSTSRQASDWYVIPIEGGEARQTGLRKIAEEAKLEIVGQPMRWVSNAVYFNARVGDGINTWRVAIDPRTFQCSGEKSRVTSSSGSESHITVNDGTIVYANTLNNDDVYILPIDTDQAKVTGEPTRLTRNTAPEYGANISHDGKKVGYAALMSGKFVVSIRDLESGADTRVASIPGTGTAAIALSPDGKRMAWSLRNIVDEIHIGSLDGGSVKLASTGLVRSWGGNPDRLLVTRVGKDEAGVYLLDVDSGTEAKLMGGSIVTSGIHLSIDGRSVVFYSANQGTTKVYLMPVFENRQLTEQDLLAITDGKYVDVLPEISPSGRIVYFYSNRDGSQCLWAQRVTPEPRKLDGELFVVKHFHSARISPAYVGAGRRRIDTAHDKIVFTMAERTGNIWRADLPQ